MKNIRVLKTGINVSKILAQLKEYPEDWNAVSKMESAKSCVDEHGFPEVDAGVLQLIVGKIKSIDEYVGDSELSVPTPAYYKHTHVVNFLKRHFPKHDRCGFLSLPVGGTVGKHIDIGSYYQTRDRYHLAIQGKYEYSVGDESYVVEPGTLLWFNNKLEHGTKNVGDCVRITFVFDVSQSKR